MQFWRYLLFSFLAIIICSCDTVYFEEPQPINKRALKNFPKKYRGTHHGDDEGNWIEVYEKHALQIRTFKEEINEKDLHSFDEYQLDGDSIIYKTKPAHLKLPYVIKDSIIRFSYKDTTKYEISDSLVFKKTKNHVILNALGDNGYWTIAILTFDRNNRIDELKIPSSDKIKLAKKYGIKKVIIDDEDKSFKDILWKGGFKSNELEEFIKNGGCEDEDNPELPPN